MHKGKKDIQILWDHQKKTAFGENNKNARYVRSLGQQPHFGAYTEAKTSVARGQVH